MKRILLLLFFVSAILQAQTITIPDSTFKANLLASDSSNSIAYGTTGYIKIDANSDSQIQLSEALAVTRLKLNYTSIHSLQGILSFPNLTELECKSTQLASLNPAGLAYLTRLDIGFSSVQTLSVTGLPALEYLICSNNGMDTLTGLTDCPNLINVYCGTNSITTLDCTGLTHLESFNCEYNHLTELKVAGCSNLVQLCCRGHSIPNLDVSGLTNLSQLYTENNYGPVPNKTLNASGCSGLVSLVATGNGLNEVNLTGCVALQGLLLSSNHLTAIDLSDLVSLVALNLNNNPIETVDASECINLQNCQLLDMTLLESLNIKNGAAETAQIAGDTVLQYICADENDVAGLHTQIILDNSLAVCNPYCDFVPGGQYNTISGYVRYDFSGNGCDETDFPIPFFKVGVNYGNTNLENVYSDSTGHYSIYRGIGDLNLTPHAENSTFFTVSPPISNVPFLTANGSVEIRDFCVAPNGFHPDLEVLLVPVTQPRPGFPCEYDILYKNKGNQLLSGDITFTYNVGALNYISSNPDVGMPVNGQFSFSYSNLLPFEKRWSRIFFLVHGPTEASPVNIGDVLEFSLSGSSSIGDQIPLDNQFVVNSIVQGSYDPNEKICVEGNTVSTSKIGDYLHYIINFENTGNYPAENIVVKDMIDTAKFDIASLQVLNTSHPAVTRITGNKTEFIFENINLDPAAHGNVVFKIKTKSTLVAGNTVTNKADIFFDYNAQITTNTASTTFQNLGIGENTSNASVSIYPNPSKGLVHVTSDSEIKTISVFDIQGRLTASHIIGEMNAALDIDNYAPGMYILKVTTAKGSKIQKLIKE
jgi:hypothetical protein